MDLRSKLSNSENTVTSLKYEVEQIKNQKSVEHEENTNQTITQLKEEHLKLVQELKKNHQDEIDFAKAGSLLKQLLSK